MFGWGRRNGRESLGRSSPMGSARLGAWYRDPHGAADERWWDGKRWTDKVRCTSGAAGSGAAETSVVQPSQAIVEQVARGVERQEQGAADATMASPGGAGEGAGGVVAQVTVHHDADSNQPLPSYRSIDRDAAGEDAAAADDEAVASAYEDEAVASAYDDEPPAEQTPTVGEFSAPAGTNGTENGAANHEVPTRVCPHCATLSHTSGDFCPHCGGRFSGGARARGSRLSKRVKVVGASVLLLLVLGGAGVAVAIKLHDDSVAAAQQHRSAAAAAAAAQARKQQQLQRQQQQQQQQQAQQAEVTVRQTAENELQQAITKDAANKANQGLLTNGTATSTTCTP